MGTNSVHPPLIGSLCSGYGGLDLGVQSALGGSLAWHAEVDPGASRILARHWPGCPTWATSRPSTGPPSRRCAS
ncbi:hypothetical protein NKH18_07045 [Streptomyces sp. M10(2022)]